MWLNLETLEWHEPCMTQITTDSGGKVKRILNHVLILWDTFLIPCWVLFTGSLGATCWIMRLAGGWLAAGEEGGCGATGPLGLTGAERDLWHWQGWTGRWGRQLPRWLEKLVKLLYLLCVLWEIALSFCWSHYFVLLTFHKMLLWNYDEEIKQISSGSANHNYWYLEIFAGIAIKLEKVGPTFSSFNPCPSLASVATFDRKQFQYLNIVLNNKTGPLLSEFSWREDTIQLFKKMANSVTL